MKGDVNMSLVNGMGEMFKNDAAMEAAERDIMFEDELALESGESVDYLIDGVPEDYPEIYDDDDYEEAIEAAALTGREFLNSLSLSQGDPIEAQRRMHGSLGPSSSAANFSSNFHDDFTNENDPVDAYPGSLGPHTSTANFVENFHDEYEDDNDPLNAIPGSLGPDASTPRDPAIEGTLALGFLTDDNYEDFDQYIAEEGIRSWYRGRKVKKRDLDSQLIGVPSMDFSKLDQMCDDGMWTKAEANVNSMIKQVESRRKAFAYGDKDSKKKDAAAKRLLRSYNGLLVHISMGKNQSELEKKGYDSKTARQAARAKANELKKSLKAAQKLNASTESAIDLAIDFDMALEAFEDAGSIGQNDSYANFSGNYTDGNDDSSATYLDKIPGAPSAASFDENFGGGFLDQADPIIAGNSSVGPDTSTARDPATESYDDILEELSMIEAELAD